MINTLYGEVLLEPRDMAMKVIAKAVSKPFIELLVHDIDEQYFKFFPLGPDREIEPLNFPGYYAIYHEFSKDEMECIYVGVAAGKNTVSQRIYRFLKELKGVSRHDEEHSGARKARLDGLTLSDKLLIKVLPLEELPFEVYGDVVKRVDTHIAGLLNAKYNERKRK